MGVDQKFYFYANYFCPRSAYAVARSHPGVIRPAAAFGRDPDNVLGRVFDVAGFAVHAVLRVDLQPVSVVGIFNVLIHASRAVARFWPCVQRQVDVDRNTCIF